MKQYLTHPVFHITQQCAHKINMPAYVVGGWVRDLLLHRPCKDIDMVCVGDGIALAQAVAKKLGNKTNVTVFKTYGTAQIKLHDVTLEFVGARTESYGAASRNPIVKPGTLLDDQLRRDFTVNALAISLNDDFGALIDAFNGMEHLSQKKLVTPTNPDITFTDDPLRMLRAIRFASQLKFEIAAEALAAINKNAHRISIISQERITDEINKIILSSKPSIGFKLLFDTGLLQLIFPQMVALHGVSTINGKSHKDNFYHTLQVLDNVCKTSDDLWLRWAAILHDIAKPATKRYEPNHGWTFHGHEDKGARMVPGIFKQFKLPLSEPMRFVQKLVKLHLRPIVLAQEIVTDSAIRRLLFEAGDDIDALMKLCTADITSKNEMKVKRFLNNYELVKQKLIEVEEKDRIRNWQPPITGEIIMQTFNLKPSPAIGTIKQIIRDAILDGDINNNYDEAYALMIKTAASLGIKPGN
ncbi:MAG: HD domain-containing protein [Bacteroidia bacterium]|nr:HD domain-containing protein [Bacteroidia bacterium]HQV00417.1 HD domain-containing protein [Bacteroidia bacterium]